MNVKMIILMAILLIVLICALLFGQSDAGFLNDGSGGLGCYDHTTGRLVAIVPGEITTIPDAQAWCDAHGY